MLKGRIIKNISNLYTVLCGEVTYDCTPRGKFRLQKKTPLVGDICVIDEENKYILELEPRKNELKRPVVCNVDVTLIVTAAKKPDFSSLLLDKELSLSLLSLIEPVIYFSKLDLLNEEERRKLSQIMNTYKEAGFTVFDLEHVLELTQFLQKKVVVLTGQTGAGKSTLLNKIAPHLKIKTGEISEALNRGKHTTRHTEIYHVSGIDFCDTPGFSSLDLSEYTKEDIRNSFPEFARFTCQFKDCMHLKEKGCAVKEAVLEGKIAQSRYDNYQKIVSEEEYGNRSFVSKK